MVYNPQEEKKIFSFSLYRDNFARIETPVPRDDTNIELNYKQNKTLIMNHILVHKCTVIKSVPFKSADAHITHSSMFYSPEFDLPFSGSFLWLHVSKLYC